MLTGKWTPMNASVLKFNQLVQETAVHSGEIDDDICHQSESEDRRRLIQSQRIAEDMRVLQIDTRGMDAADAAIINAQKARIRAAYPPPPN
ncbi:hypothetical protein Tco_1475237 [Tanacetum coccineum]